MQPFCCGPLRVCWVDRMLQADFLRPDAMPIRLEQTLFLLMHLILRPKFSVFGVQMQNLPIPIPNLTKTSYITLNILVDTITQVLA